MTLDSTTVGRKEIGDEPLPGYRLVEPLGCGGFGEVWKCEVPGGLLKAIKFVKGGGAAADAAPGTRDSAAVEFQAIQRIKSIRHPFLLSIERVDLVAGEMLLVMELADRNLADRLAECQAAGQAGIDREELLAYLMEAAEALDVMNLKHGLQHLDVKPANLFVVGNHLKVADFGLVNSLEESPPGGAPGRLHGLTPRYVAPETLLGKVSRHSDQYSLAIVYQELLTGTFPFPGDDPRKLMTAHLMGEPDLATLPDGDRPFVARALAKDPHRRFPSCLHFIQALVFGTDQETGVAHVGRTVQRFPCPAAPPLTQPMAATKVIKRIKPSTIATKNHETLVPPPPAPGSDTPRDPPAANANLTLPGYQLLTRITRDPFGELFLARDAQGRERKVRFLTSEGGGISSDPRLLARLTSLRHPALPRLEAKAITNGRLALISEGSEETLQDRYDQCVARGLPGIPRAELLHHLGQAAAALDALQRRELLQHLGLSPRAVLLHESHVRLGDFGLTQLIWLPRWQHVPHLNRRYAAPELLSGSPNPTCDAYSLALIFVEMLTGSHPFSMQPGAAEPDLMRLPPADRAILARALHANPHERFRSGAELINALRGGPAPADSLHAAQVIELPFILPLGNLSGGNESLTIIPSIHRIVTQVVLADSGGTSMRLAQQLPYLQRPDLVLESRFPIRLLPGLIRLKMDAFCQKWDARIVSQSDHLFVVRLQETGTFWQRWFGQQAGLEVRLELRTPASAEAHTAEVTATVRPFGGLQHDAAQKLPELGPLLLVSLRDDLQNIPEQRGQVRWPCSPLLDLYPLQSDGAVSAGLPGQGHDISLGGIALWTAERPACRFAYLHLKSHAELAPLALLIRIVRVEPWDGGFKSGAIFLTDEARSADSTFS